MATSRTTVVTQTGAGTSNWIPLDFHVHPFNVGLYAKVSGTVSFSLEVTGDDPLSGATPDAYTMASPFAASTSASAFGALTIPAKAIRINNASGSGSIKLTIVESGIR